jgi:hypothetical protein
MIKDAIANIPILRVGRLLWNHRKRLLLAASTVLYSRDLAVGLAPRQRSSYAIEEQSEITEANVLYHSLLELTSGERYGPLVRNYDYGL